MGDDIFRWDRESRLPFFKQADNFFFLVITRSNQFAQVIFHQTKSKGVLLAIEQVRPILSKNYPTPALRPLNSQFDLNLLQERFGIIPPHWHDAMSETMHLRAEYEQWSL
jgi:dTDP-4-dehydrorhamnose reductase